MEPIHQDTKPLDLLKSELKLQINRHLFERGIISREVYEQAKVKLVAPT